MDIIKILSDIKGKALDVAHFELLKSAYELQNQNIEQLKNNNEALNESNSLLKEKVSSMGKHIIKLEKQLEAIEKQIPSRVSRSSVSLSEVARSILIRCLELDVTEFTDENMIRNLKHSRIKVEAAIDELSNLNLISIGSVSYGGGEVDYYLTSEGKQFILTLK